MDGELKMSRTEAGPIYAPIALFAYNRPTHTRKTIEALARNDGASESILYIFSDQAKSLAAVEAVNEVRSFIHDISGFKEVIIIEQTENFGLAKSIISGVTNLCGKYGRVIVLEDDIETSPFFLKFMNESLDFYENTPEVMHISGCRYPVDSFGSEDTFFLHVPLCWGWATWQRAWVNFEKNISLMKRFDTSMKRHFDFENSYTYWKQLESNKEGKMDTWFVFWYANIFLQDGLSLFPARSLVNNIGMDESGTHSLASDVYKSILSKNPIKLESISLNENIAAYNAHTKYFSRIKESFSFRVVRKLKSIFI